MITAMAALKLNIPDELRAAAEARAAESGHSSLDEYLAALIRADSESDLSDELEQHLLAGLESGPAAELPADFWHQLKRRVRLPHRGE
jgi:plasmid stability protein